MFFLWAGLNDINANTATATIYGYLQSLWSAARSSGYKVVAFTLAPCANLTAPQQAARNALNSLMLGDATLYDSYCPSGLSAAQLRAFRYISTDGSHFTDETNKLIAKEVSRVLLGVGSADNAPYTAMASENLFINGDFSVSQESGSTTLSLATGVAKYVADGAISSFKNAAGVVTATRIDAASASASVPGLGYYHRMTATTALIRSCGR